MESRLNTFRRNGTGIRMWWKFIIMLFYWKVCTVYIQICIDATRFSSLRVYSLIILSYWKLGPCEITCVFMFIAETNQQDLDSDFEFTSEKRYNRIYLKAIKHLTILSGKESLTKMARRWRSCTQSLWRSGGIWLNMFFPLNMPS